MTEFNSYYRNLILPKLFTKPEKVLDLAGGEGIVAEWLRDKIGCDVHIVDNSEQSIIKVRVKGFGSALLDIEKKRLPYLYTFDTVFWGDNIEHLYNPVFVLKEIYRVLRKNGRLIISTPNMSYWYYRYYYFKTGCLPCTERFITDKNTWEWLHIRYFNKEILEDLLNRYGFKIMKVYGAIHSKHKIQSFMCRYFPELFGNILILEAKKGG